MNIVSPQCRRWKRVTKVCLRFSSLHLHLLVFAEANDWRNQIQDGINQLNDGLNQQINDGDQIDDGGLNPTEPLRIGWGSPMLLFYPISVAVVKAVWGYLRSDYSKKRKIKNEARFLSLERLFDELGHPHLLAGQIPVGKTCQTVW